MIARLTGELAESSCTACVVDAGGVGYDVSIPLSTFDKLPHLGERVRLYIHTQVREDAITLFGFATQEEREQAQALCKAEGGHLAVISSAEELAEITALAEEAGAKFVWIGLHREAGELKWVTGESVDYYVWGSGEPSVTDSDGTPEDYVLLWHTDSGWIYNDCRNDPAAAYPSVYGGKLAYACEYDSE